MAHVFISYSHKDSDFVFDTLQPRLKDHFDLWIDEERLHAGEKWRDEIERAIRSSFALVVIMTPSAKASEFVTYEWACAWGAGIKVIPIVLQPTNLHPQLDALQYLNFIDRSSRPWEKLVSRLEKLINGESYEISQTGLVVSRVAEDEISACIKDLHSENRKLRIVAAKALGRFGDQGAIPELTKALRDQDWEVRQAAAESLQTIGKLTVVPHLEIVMLTDIDPRVRRTAAQSLFQVSWKHPEPSNLVLAFVDALGDDDPDVRVEVSSALFELEGKYLASDDSKTLHAVSKLLNANIKSKFRKHLRDENWKVRQNIALALMNMEEKGKFATDLLLEMLDDEHSEVLGAVVLAVGSISITNAVPKIVKILNNPDDPILSEHAERSLEWIGTPEALAAIEEWKQRNSE